MVFMSSILILQLIIKNITMFKVKQNDIFAKNMSSAELYQVWQNMKSTKEINKICAKLIVQLDKKYKV